MKKTRNNRWNKIILTSFLSLLSFLSSCQKAPINGDLDGQWLVVDVYPSPPYEIINSRLYFNFYLHVCMLTCYAGKVTDANMRYDGDYLYLDFPYYNESNISQILPQFGIYSNQVTFKVEFLDKKNLILTDDIATVTLRKH